MNCSDLERLLPAFADGEFTPEDSVEIELHLASCQGCSDEVEDQIAFRAFLQSSAVAACLAPTSLRLEVRRGIARQRAAENLRRFGGYSAVAASLVAIASAGYLLADPGRRGPRHLEVVMDAVDKHARALPVEVTPAGGDVEGWFRGKVDFNVRPPVFRSPEAPRLVGARLANVRDRQAAYFVYGGDDRPNKRMTLLVFPGGDLRLPEGKRRQVGGQDVLLANERGYNVALWRKRGILYSLVSDLDENDVLQLVSQVEDR